MKVLIVGANYNNKGAQAMLYVAVDEISRRFPGCDIYFGTNEDIDDEDLTFHPVFYTYDAKIIAEGGIHGFSHGLKVRLKDVAKKLLGRKKQADRIYDLKRLIKNIDLIVDVSGFILGEQWPVRNQVDYLETIKLAKQFEIPIYLMPQSFGPFNYTGDKASLLADMKELLKYPRLIFAREQEGYELLKSKFALENIRLSTDLVLQNTGVSTDRLFKSRHEVIIPALSTENNVAIVPNKQCFSHGAEEPLMNLYAKIIDTLIKEHKDIYIFRHSDDDMEICRRIKALFPDNAKVHLLEEDLSCLEYDAFIKNFQFVICSRFHGIVHAYRNGVPCIALGWAIKYKELAHNVGQDGYVFDITASKIEVESIMIALRKMIINGSNESEIIKERVSAIQNDNCFDLLEEDFVSLSH